MPRPKIEKAYYSSRLMKALAQIMNYRLTVVCAPSGAGKTTAVKTFFAGLRQQAPRTLWYTSFGETPDAGWNRVCDLLAKVDEAVAERVRGLGFPSRQTMSLLAEMIQDFRCGAATVLVIDNARLPDNELPYELLGVLAMHQCDNFHIVVITQNPLDETARVISTPGVLFLGTDHFFFTAAEAAAYFKLNEIDLTPAEIRQVMSHTLGWAAALRLQLLGYRQTGVIQKEAGIEQLMHAVIWEPLTQEERYFIIAFSQIGYATPGQICALAGCEKMPAYGRNILARGGFLSYDAGENRHIMHEILREFAQNRLEELPKSEQKALQVRAGQVYAESGMHFPALRCFLRAGEYTLLLETPLTNADMAEYGTGEVVALLSDILASCPPETLGRYPGRLLRFAFEFLIRGEKNQYQKTCAMLNQFFRQRGTGGGNTRREFRGEYIFLRSFDAFNDIAKMNAAHKAALRVLGGPSKAFDARRYWTFGVPSILAAYWSLGSSLASQMDLFERGMPDYIALTNGHGVGAAELMRAEAHLHAGRLDEAEILCSRAVFLAETQCQDTVYFGGQLVLGHIAILRGAAEGYRAALAHIQNRALAGTEKARHMLAGQCAAQLEIALGRLDDIPDWLMDEVEIRSHMYENGICYAMRLYAKQLLLRQEYNKLLGFAGPMLEAAKRQNSVLLMIYYHMYLACAFHAVGAAPNAEKHLAAALELALPDQIYLPFAMNLEWLAPMAEDLPLADEREARHMAQSIRLGKKQKSGAAKIWRTLYGAGGKLTKREQEIAALAKKGHTNKEIAAILSISPETAKMTLQKVFKKLRIHSRQQLIDKKF